MSPLFRLHSAHWRARIPVHPRSSEQGQTRPGDVIGGGAGEAINETLMIHTFCLFVVYVLYTYTYTYANVAHVFFVVVKTSIAIA